MSHPVTPTTVKMAPLGLVAVVLSVVGAVPVWLTVVLAVMGSVAIIVAALITKGNSKGLEEKLGQLEERINEHLSGH